MIHSLSDEDLGDMREQLMGEDPQRTQGFQSPNAARLQALSQLRAQPTTPLTPPATLALAAAPAAAPAADTLPIPSNLVAFFYWFALVLFAPDVLFNFRVYLNGGDALGDAGWQYGASVALWLFIAAGLVVMPALCGVLLPYLWRQRRLVAALFCVVGVLLGTAVTMWNSVSFRAEHGHMWKTDELVAQLLPWIGAHHISVTTGLAAVVPPLWGLFWAFVQPTRTRTVGAAADEAHAEKLARMRREAEEKAVKAEISAQVRAAQLKGMAQTAAAARDQAKGLFAQQDAGQQGVAQQGTQQVATPQAGASVGEIRSLRGPLEGMGQGQGDQNDPSASDPRRASASLARRGTEVERAAAQSDPAFRPAEPTVRPSRRRAGVANN